MDGTILMDVLDISDEDECVQALLFRRRRVLELFSGTHSIGKVAHGLGYEVVSLDRDLGGECPFKSGYKSDTHIKADIMTWDYKKKYPEGHFDVITASPVCLFWSHLRNCWIGRKSKKIHPTDIITKEHIQADIDRYGKPMVDKVFEIIDYFKPKYWWVENPATGRMKEYITDKPFYDVDYCKYSNWGYKKRTRFWTNIKGFEAKKCKKDCDNMVEIDEGKKHKKVADGGGDRRKGEGKPKQHQKVLANGYEMVDGKKVLCNTKELRKLHKTNLGNTERRQLAKKQTKDVSITCGSNKLERYRIPEKLIEALFFECK